MATANGAPTFPKARPCREREGKENRVDAAYCFTIPDLQMIVMDGQRGCHIFLMDDEPLTLCALIKWQIITLEICICLWSRQTFILELVSVM